MKGPYRKEVVDMLLREYPCRWCNKECIDTHCRKYHSCHEIYTRIGKATGLQLHGYLNLCTTEQMAMEAVLQYNQY